MDHEAVRQARLLAQRTGFPLYMRSGGGAQVDTPHPSLQPHFALLLPCPTLNRKRPSFGGLVESRGVRRMRCASPNTAGEANRVLESPNLYHRSSKSDDVQYT